MAILDSSASRPVRLVIVDADRRVRDSLAALVGSSEDVEVLGGAGHLASAVELIEANEPDVVIVDPRLPEVDTGLALIATIRRRWPGIGLLAMSWSDELAATCRECGVDGFIPKTESPNEFVEAIVRAGGAAVDRQPSEPSPTDPRRPASTLEQD